MNGSILAERNMIKTALGGAHYRASHRETHGKGWVVILSARLSRGINVIELAETIRALPMKPKVRIEEKGDFSVANPAAGVPDPTGECKCKLCRSSYKYFTTAAASE